MMMASMPKPEFIVAASIDTEKWLKLKAAPPLAMGLGLAMMQGISITEKDDFLLIASKDHIESTQSGSVKNPVSGSGKELFAKNDFVLKNKCRFNLEVGFTHPSGRTRGNAQRHFLLGSRIQFRKIHRNGNYETGIHRQK